MGVTEVQELIELATTIQSVELVNTIAQIVSNIFVVIGAVFAYYQYRKQKKLTKVSNAIALAKYFATDIIDKACLVYSVFCDNDEIMNIIKKHYDEIKNAECFNTKEYEKIFSEIERVKYDKFLIQTIKLPDEKEVAIGDLLQEVINELEHCSISFNTGLADDKAVYQSMHQVILNLFPCAYPWIGSINRDSVDLYYTQLCQLYVRWNKIREKALKRETRANKRMKKYEQKLSNSGMVKSPRI